MSDAAATSALVAGYAAAVPLTVFVPGFLRLWRRREVELLATVAVGLLVVALAWLGKGSAVLAALHVAGLVGLTSAWLRAGGRSTAQA